MTSLSYDHADRVMVMKRADGSKVEFTDDEWELIMRAADYTLYQRYQALAHFRQLHAHCPKTSI